MSGKKRKAQQELSGQHNKKPLLSAAPNATTIRVRYLSSPDIAKPVLASSPGALLPTNLSFKPFAKPIEGGSEILLRSSDHPTIDFTATEGTGYAANRLKHYVAVYDPDSGRMDITEAKKVTVRRTIRQAEPEQAEDAASVPPTSNYSSRSALTHTFGTKKSKKLVQSRAENVLYSRDADQNAANPLSEVLLSSMPEVEALPSTPDGRIIGTEAAIQAAKPLPVPDLAATDVSQAYPLSNLVFPAPHADTLTAMPTSEWRTALSAGKAVETTSRYAANRIANITQAANAHPSPTSPQTTTLQLLRYILLLIEFARAIKRFRPDKRIPSLTKWTPARINDLSKYPTPLLDSLLKKYCPSGNGPTKFDLALLHTTIFTLTLHIPPPSGNAGAGTLVTDPSDVQQDLSLSPDETRKYLRELGCKYETATEQELERWGFPKPGGREKEVKHKYAKLRLPLRFPQMGRGPPLKRR